jgi:hypothetical protein
MKFERHDLAVLGEPSPRVHGVLQNLDGVVAE